MLRTLPCATSVLRGHASEVQAVAFVQLPEAGGMPPPWLLASGSLDGCVRLWDGATLVFEWIAHGGGVVGMASPEAGTLWTQARDGHVYCWRLELAHGALKLPALVAAVPSGIGTFCRLFARTIRAPGVAAAVTLIAVPELDSASVGVWSVTPGTRGSPSPSHQVASVAVPKDELRRLARERKRGGGSGGAAAEEEGASIVDEPQTGMVMCVELLFPALAACEPLSTGPSPAPPLTSPVWLACSYDDGCLYVLDAGMELLQSAAGRLQPQDASPRTVPESPPAEPLPPVTCTAEAQGGRPPRVVLSAPLSDDPLLTFALLPARLPSDGGDVRRGVAGSAGDALVVFELDLCRRSHAVLCRIPLAVPGVSVSAVPQGARAGDAAGLVLLAGWDGALHAIDAYGGRDGTGGLRWPSAPLGGGPLAPPPTGSGAAGGSVSGVYGLAARWLPAPQPGVEDALEAAWGDSTEPESPRGALAVATGTKGGRVVLAPCLQMPPPVFY